MATLEDTRIGLEVDTSKVAPALDQVPDDVDDTIDEVDSRWSKITDVLGDGAKVAGAAAGATLIASAIEGMDREAGSDKIAAQMRLDPAAQATAGSLAGKLYAGAYADSFGEAETAVATVGDLLTGFDDDGALDRLSVKALDYAATFDQDVTDAVGRAQQLITDGLAPDADAAFDLMVAASQDVPAHLRGDAMDALEEYGKSFQQLGIGGAGALELISQADDRFTLDKMGDALKELTIRAADGSEASTEALGRLGLFAGETATDIAAGGDTAADAMADIVDRLSKIRDPAEQAQTAIALFGAPLEDLGGERIPAFLESLTSATRATGDLEGRADELGDTLNSNTRTTVKGVARGIENWVVGLTEADNAVGTVTSTVGGLAVAAQPLAPVMTGVGLVFRDQLGSIGSAAASSAGTVGRAFVSVAQRGVGMAANLATSTGSAIASTASWAAAQVAAGGRAAASMAKTSATFVAKYALMAGRALASAARIATSWLIAMGPIAVVIAAVVGLGVLIVKNWDKIRAWTSRAWNAVSGKVAEVWNAITGAVSRGTSRAVDHVRALPGRLLDGLRTLGTTVLDFIVRYHPAAVIYRKSLELWPRVRAWLTGLPGRIVSSIGDLAGTLKSKGEDVVRGLWEGIKSMGSWLADKVSSFVTDKIPGPIARALGIASPSRVAAALGQEVPAGLAMGMTDETSAVVAAAERIAAAAVPTVPTIGRVAPTTSGQQTAAAGGASAGVSFTGDIYVRDRDDAELLGRELAWSLS